MLQQGIGGSHDRRKYVTGEIDNAGSILAASLR
jgi:hypothetical protein